MAKMIIPERIPDWLAILPKSANISQVDFANAVGLTHAGLARRILRNEIPLHDSKKNKMSYFAMDVVNGIVPVENKAFGKNFRKHFWKASTVRNYIRKLIRDDILNK